MLKCAEVLAAARSRPSAIIKEEGSRVTTRGPGAPLSAAAAAARCVEARRPWRRAAGGPATQGSHGGLSAPGPPQENCTRNILSINRLLIGMVLYCTLECLPTITKQLASTNEWPLHMLGVTANWSVPCRSRFVRRHYKYIILARTHFYKAFHNPEILGGVLRLSCISHLPPPQVRSKSPFKEGGTLQGRVFPILNMRTA